MRFLSQSSALARFDLSRMWVLGVAPYCARTRMHLTHTHTDIYTLNAAVAVAVAVAFARVAISGWVSVVISAAA